MESQSTHIRMPIPSNNDTTDILPVPNIRDMDSGVSSGYSAILSGFSTPTDNNHSRRSSTYSERYECSTINRTLQPSTFFRQVSFDDAWEKSDIVCCQSQNGMQNTSCDHTKCNTMRKRIRGKTKFKNNTDEQLKGTNQRRARVKLIKRRRKSVATRSKVA